MEKTKIKQSEMRALEWARQVGTILGDSETVTITGQWAQDFYWLNKY